MMATIAVEDASVETGHDLILSTLLVHFDADEIDELPHALQPIVQDVYDIAQNLVDTKVKYQSEMALLQQELEQARNELAATPSAPSIANATTAVADVHVATTECSSHRVKSQVMRSIATQTRTRLPSPPTTLFGEKGGRLNRQLGAAASAATQGCRSPRPGRVVSSSDVDEPLKNFVFDSKLILNGAGPGETFQARASVMKLLRKQPVCPAAPASTGTQQATAVARPRKQVKSAPGKSVSTSRHQQQPTPTLLDEHKTDQTIRACLALQMTCELRLLLIQTKLNQVIQWKAETISGGLVRVSIGSTLKGIRSYSVGEIQSALRALQEEATELLQSCTQGLSRVPEVSDDKRWLRGRHTVLEEMVMQMDEWCVDVASVLDKFPSGALAAAKHQSPISIRVWNDVKQKRGYVNAAAINLDELRAQHAKPAPLRVVLTEFAVCSFVAHVYGVFAASFVCEYNFTTLTQIGQLAQDLEWLAQRCAAAERGVEEEGEEQWRVAKSSAIFKRRHAISLTAIQRRATVCSETICGVPSRIRGHFSAFAASYATQVTSSNCLCFPASMYTWTFYEDVVVAIVSCHVTLTRVADVALADRSSAIYHLIQRLDQISNALAPWADPRFAEETSTRSFEKREYLQLMDWCERLCVHVSRFDSNDA